VGLIISGNRTGDYSLVKESWNALREVCNEKERPFHEGAYWYADTQESFGNYMEAIKWFQHVTEDWWKPLGEYESWLLNDARKRLNILIEHSMPMAKYRR